MKVKFIREANYKLQPKVLNFPLMNDFPNGIWCTVDFYIDIYFLKYKQIIFECKMKESENIY